MWNTPTEKQLAALPNLLASKDMSVKDIKIRMHFFMGSCDWYIAEYDPVDRLFFGYAIIGGDLQMAEWGSISFDELEMINIGGIEVDRDLYWTPKPFSKVMVDYKKAHRGTEKGFGKGWHGESGRHSEARRR